MNDLHVSFREKCGYGLGDAASNIFWKLFSMYLLFFYTDIFGLPAAAVGTMFLVTRIWDALIDPVVGVMADRTQTRWGKFRPYLLWFLVPFGVLGVLTFTTPDFGPTGKLVYAYVTYSLMMMVYSLVNVPYASLLGVISPDTKVRTTLSSFRMVFAFGGGILSLVLIEPLVRAFGSLREVATAEGSVPDQQLGWSAGVAVLALVAMLFLLCTFLWTRERVRPVGEQKNALRDDIRDLFRNSPWWILLGSGIFVLIFNSIRDGAAVYYFKYFVDAPSQLDLGWIGGSVTLVTLYLVLGQIANIAGILLMAPVANRIGKKRTYLGAMLLAGVLSVAFYFLGSDDIVPILVLQVLISVCAGSVMPLLWSMYADTADYSEVRTGRRATGLIFSSSSMSQKFGWTLGGALTGWLLAWFGFEANQVQAEGALTGIRMMLSILPAAGALLSVLFLLFYPLNERRVEEIGRKLEAARADAARSGN